MGLSSCSYVCTHVWGTLKLFVALPPPVGDHARLLGSSPPRAARAPACPARRGRHRLGAPCYCGGCRICDTPPPPPLLDGNARALLPCPAATLRRQCSRSRHVTDQPTAACDQDVKVRVCAAPGACRGLACSCVRAINNAAQAVPVCVHM